MEKIMLSKFVKLLLLPSYFILMFNLVASVGVSAEILSAGGLHTCAVKSDGTLACWGNNNYVQATPSNGNYLQVSVDSGGSYSCALKSDNTLVCWGSQVTLPSGTFSQVSTGAFYACAVRTDKTLACWGSNSHDRATPPSGKFLQVSAGGSHACAVRTDNTLVCWGGNFSGQVTHPSGTFLQVSAGGAHTCAVRADATLACWGGNSDSQATPPSGNYLQVSAGFFHNCAVRNDGTLDCWGSNRVGETTPPSGTFSQVSAGGGHTCGVKTDGTVACWGSNNNGQATPPETIVLSTETLIEQPPNTTTNSVVEEEIATIQPLLYTQLTANDGATNGLGLSVALSGDTALVGLDASIDSNYVYIFTHSGTTWSQQAKLTPNDASSSNFFGGRVALSGNTALVGARSDNDNGINSGSAYIFMRSGTNWSQQAKLTPNMGDAGDQFGSSVALSGDTALIGASGSESAYIFTRSGTTWNQQIKLTPNDGGTIHGRAVALDGDTALVDASLGSVYIFVRSGTTWNQQARITSSKYAAYFGWSVALSGDTAIIGDWSENSSSGSAYIFTRSGTTWSQQARLSASDGNAEDQFGESVAISGNTALVGADTDEDKGYDSGSAYIFTRSGTTWTQQTKLTASDLAVSNRFGYAVALSGNIALVGSHNESAYTFVISDGENLQPTELQTLPATTLSGATSQAQFTGGATNEYRASLKNNFTATDTIDVIGKLTVAPNDVGKEGSIFIVVVLTNSGVDGIYMRDGKQWKLWDGNPANLTVIEGLQTLNATEEVIIVTGLKGFSGNFNAFFGYKANNEIHYNAKPIQFSVSP